METKENLKKKKKLSRKRKLRKRGGRRKRREMQKNQIRIARKKLLQQTHPIEIKQLEFIGQWAPFFPITFYLFITFRQQRFFAYS